MSVSVVVDWLVSVTSTFDLRAVVTLFIICAVGEFGVPVPYVLETMWLLIGFQAGVGQLALHEAFGFWLAALLGRLVGCLALYYAFRSGALPFARMVRNRFGAQLMASSKMDRLRVESAFLVAFGRLLGLRIPLTMLAAGKGTLLPLLGGVLISSVVFDGMFLVIGTTVGTSAQFSFPQMLAASLGGLTALYLATVAVRFLRRTTRRVSVL